MIPLIAKQYVEALSASAPLRDALLAFDVVAALSAALTPAWSVDREIDPAGELAIIIVPARDEANRPNFVLYEENGLVQVSTIVGDRWQKRQTFPTCQRAVAAIVAAAVLVNS